MKGFRVVPALALLTVSACGPATNTAEPAAPGQSPLGRAASLGTCTTSRQVLPDPGFESAYDHGWFHDQDVSITDSGPYPARAGSWKAWMGGNGLIYGSQMTQVVTIPETACGATFSFWMRIDTDEPRYDYREAFDSLTVSVLDSGWEPLETLAQFSEWNESDDYVEWSFELSAYRGRTIALDFKAYTDNAYQTSFLVDDTTLVITE